MATAVPQSPTSLKTLTNSTEEKQKLSVSVGSRNREEEEEEERVSSTCVLPTITKNGDSLEKENEASIENEVLIKKDEKKDEKEQLHDHDGDMKFMEESSQDYLDGDDGGRRSPKEGVAEDRRSVKSWSPETYNGSITEDEEETNVETTDGADDLKFDFAKSCEPFVNIELDESPSLSASTPSASSAPSPSSGTPTPIRKSLKSWLGKKISRKKQKDKMGLELESPPRIRQGSYTQRTKHITDKYVKISKEKRASQPAPPAATTPDQPVKQVWHDHIPKTVEDFVPSTLYQQLKYKLTIVLQQIHLPEFDTSGIEEDVRMKGERGRCKEELIQILKVVRHSVQWRDDYSETGVLDEVIGQLECLDNTWLVTCTVSNI